MMLMAFSEEAYAGRYTTLVSGGVSKHLRGCFSRVEPVVDSIILDRHMVPWSRHMLDHFRQLTPCTLNDLPNPSALLGSCAAAVLGSLWPGSEKRML